jgi:hypothetical protein
MPRRRFSTMVCAPATFMFSSPLPVAPAEAAGGGDAGNLAFAVQRRAVDGSGGRKQDSPHRRELELRLNAEIGGTLAQSLDALRPESRAGLGTTGGVGRVPTRVRDARTPPVAVGIELLPQHPDLARAVGQQVFAREAHGDRESLCSFADQHDVSGVLHHGF